MSVDYYAQLERGDLADASDEMLATLARAQRLDEAETSHLFGLTRAAQQRPIRRRRPTGGARTVRPSLQRFLDAITGARPGYATSAWISSPPIASAVHCMR